MSLQLTASAGSYVKQSPEHMLADRTRFAIEQSKGYVKNQLSVTQVFTNLSEYFEQGRSRCELNPFYTKIPKFEFRRHLSRDHLSGYLRP